MRRDNAEDHIDDVEQALARMDRLIDDLLTLARRGQTIGETEPVALSELATQCWEIVETGVATVECQSNLTVEADKTRLASVFENLFRNAVEHGGDDVTITVGDLPDEDGFYVADDGPGISPAERERVFESGYSSSGEGTGLGLVIVRQIIEGHGWTIRVTESQAGGARFEIAGVDIVEVSRS